MSEYGFPEEPVRFSIETFDRLLLHCVNLSASDITLQTNNQVFAEIHGRLHPITARKLSNTEVGDMLNGIYGSNGTTQIYSGKDVDTQYEVRPNRNQRFRFRVNGTGCQIEGHDGLQVTLRTIPSMPPDLSALNVEPEILKAMAPDQGTVIVTGPTGSGKSTLLAAIIKSLAEEVEGHRKMLTFESPIEFVYDQVKMPSSVMSQSEIPRHLPSFAAGVRNALRRKPRLILVGEARDVETINAVIDAALTGHPVYTTLHSNGVSDAVRRIISTFPAEERHGRALDILETLRLVVWQKLVPSVDGKRIALREYLVFDQSIRDILIETPLERLASRTRALLKERGQPMWVDAQRKFEAGLLPEREFRIIEARAKLSEQDDERKG